MNFKNIFKRNKKEERSIEIPVFGDSLLFGGIGNSHSAMNISAAYRATSIISDSIAMLPITIKEKDVLENHSLNLVFKDGLNHLTKYNFMKLLIQSVILKGNGFAFIERAEDATVTGLRFLDDVTIMYNKQKNELYYISSQLGNRKIEACNMIHLVKNSYDGVNGISVISFANRSLKIANNTENSANNFFTNGCNLSGVLTVQGQLTTKQKQEIRTSWNQAYSEGGNGLAVLQGNMDYKPIQLSAQDSQMLESRLFNVQDVARFFEISPVLLGDLSHSNYSTLEASQQDFLLHTLQPYITMVEEEFSRKLLKPSESNLRVNLEEGYILRTDKSAQASYYSTLLTNGILTINEVRKELGYNTIEGGDKNFIPFTKIADNTINTDSNEKNIQKQ